MRQPLKISCSSFNQHRPALSTPDAKRSDPALPARAFEHLQHMQHHARARSADGMADGDRAAVDVQLRAVDLAESALEAEMLLAVRVAFPRGEAAQHLRAEGLVDLD